MRILRRKSNREVSSNGFALFVIGLVMATFIGGAVRTLLRSEGVHQRITNELRNRFPQHEIKVGRTEVLLSQGLWPGFGLKVHGLEIKQDVCGKLSFALTIPEAILPVDVFSLRHGTVRLRTAQITNGRMHLNYRECAVRMEPGMTPPPADTQVTNSKSRVPPIQPLRLDWQTLSRYINGLRLNEFLVTYERNVTWKLAIHEADVSFGEELFYSARMDVHKSLPFGALVHAVEVEGRRVDRVLSWDLRSEFKEGRVTWDGNWDLNTNMARTGLKIHQLPMKDFLFELFQMGFLSQEISLKATWLTADLGWEGKVASFKESPLNIKEFTFVGGYGRAELVDPVEMKVAEEKNFRIPALVKINQLQLQPIMEALKIRVFPKVLSRLGIWSGTIVYSGWRDWRLDGYLENMEVAFSNQSVRGKQSVRRVHTLVTRSGAKLDGVIDEAVIHEGDFLGLANATWNEETRSGDLKVQFERLSLSPSIQNLLVGGEAAPLKLRGEGKLTAEGLEDWNATSEISQIQGQGWRTENIIVKAKPMGPNVRLDITAGELRLEPAWRFGSHLKDLGEEWSEGARWKNGSAQILLLKTGGEVSSLNAIEPATATNWRGLGSWVRDGAFKASLTVTKGASSRRYSIRGDAAEVQINPENGAYRQ